MNLPHARDSDSNEPMPRTVLFLLANTIDVEILTDWCRRAVICDNATGSTNFVDGLRTCQNDGPALVVLDPTISENSVTEALSALRRGHMRHLLVLDGFPREGRLIEVLPEPAASYLSRSVGLATLAGSVNDILSFDRRAFDPALAPNILLTSRGYVLKRSSIHRSIAALSARERQVMCILARGNSVQQCAEILGISPSTVDNHKARLMKKLDIHKVSELTYRAARDGLIAL